MQWLGECGIGMGQSIEECCTRMGRFINPEHCKSASGNVWARETMDNETPPPSYEQAKVDPQLPRSENADERESAGIRPTAPGITQFPVEKKHAN